MKEFTIDKYKYEVIKNVRDGFDLEEVKNKLTDYFYPYDYFYNGPLHLNETGRQARTEQLIDDLEKWLKEK